MTNRLYYAEVKRKPLPGTSLYIDRFYVMAESYDDVERQLSNEGDLLEGSHLTFVELVEQTVVALPTTRRTHTQHAQLSTARTQKVLDAVCKLTRRS